MKETRLLVEMNDSRFRQIKYKMNLEHLMPENKDTGASVMVLPQTKCGTI